MVCLLHCGQVKRSKIAGNVAVSEFKVLSFSKVYVFGIQSIE